MMEHTGPEEMDEVLEGDEAAPEIGRHRDVGATLLSTPISDVVGRTPVSVPPDAKVEKILALMKSKKVSAVMVVERKKGKKLVGIFTERDLVNRALPTRGWAKAAVSKFMTKAPQVLKRKDPVAYAINKMSVGAFRHVPLVDAAGRPAGMVSAGDILEFLVELCPEELLNLPPEPDLAVPKTVDGD